MKDPYRENAPSTYRFGLKSSSTWGEDAHDDADCLTWEVIEGVEKTEDTFIAGETMSLREDPEFDCYECEDEGCDECPSKSDEPKLSEMTLQDVLDKLPEGVEPKDVKMELSYYASCMAYESCSFAFSYDRKLDYKKQKRLYEEACRKYNKEVLAPYLIEKEKYDTWKREKDIAEMQAKLKELEDQRNA